MDGGESVASGLNEGGFSRSPPVDFERFIKPTWQATRVHVFSFTSSSHDKEF